MAPLAPIVADVAGVSQVADAGDGAGDCAARTIAAACLDLPVADDEAASVPRLPGVRRVAGSPQLAWKPGLSELAATAMTAAQAEDGAGDEHLSTEALWSFMSGELAPAEMRRALGHLLRGCGRCQEAARETWNLTPPAPWRAEASVASASAAGGAVAESAPSRGALETPETFVTPEDAENLEVSELGEEREVEAQPAQAVSAALDSAYDTVLDRVFSRVSLEKVAIEAARQRAGGLFDELMQHPAARQRLLVHNSARFRDRMLCEHLLSASHNQGFHEPARSQQLARLAVEVAERLGESVEDVSQLELVNGLRARAWAQLGNALRIGADMAGSASAFRTAEALLATSPQPGLLDKARVLDLKASLYRESRQLVEAGRQLDRVIAIYRRLGQSSLLGRALNQKAMVLSEAGDQGASMELLRRSLDLLDPHEDPRWFLVVRHNLICALVRDGRPREAFALLFHTRPLYLKMGDRMNLLRLRWVEGAVAQALSRLDQAEVAFREVRDAFLELGITYDAATVSLDLAAVFAQQGKTAELRELAVEMMAFFDSHHIHREAMAAFLFFCDAARQERAGLSLVNQVATFLKQARNAPDLLFSPSS